MMRKSQILLRAMDTLVKLSRCREVQSRRVMLSVQRYTKHLKNLMEEAKYGG